MLPLYDQEMLDCSICGKNASQHYSTTTCGLASFWKVRCRLANHAGLCGYVLRRIDAFTASPLLVRDGIKAKTRDLSQPCFRLWRIRLELKVLFQGSCRFQVTSAA